MTDKTQAIRNLLVKVEAGEWWGDLPRPAELYTDLCWKAFNGSLDAAKDLHEAVLPGWIVVQMCQLMEVDAGCNYTGGTDGWLVEISPILGSELEGSGADKSPARAWLIAILRALIAQATP